MALDGSRVEIRRRRALLDRMGVDLESAAWRKIEINARKYPAEQVRGSARTAERMD